MPMFRKKPVVIDARLFDGSPESFKSMSDWLKASGAFLTYYGNGNRIKIPTLEGIMTADPGDWIIKGVKGEFYPCKPHIFELTYEPVSSTSLDTD